MRLLLLYAIAGTSSVAALVRPQIGLLAYTWYSLMRPDVLAWVEHKTPISIILALCTLLGSISHLPGRVSVLFTNPITRLVMILLVVFALSAVFAVDPTLSWSPLKDFTQMLVMVLLIPILIRTERDLQLYFLVMALSLGAIGAKLGVFGILAGGVRYAYGYGGMMRDNNALALGLAMCIPLCWYGRQLTKSIWIKTALLGAAFASVAAIIMTYSRTGAICLALAVLMIAFRTRHRIFVLIAAATIALVVVSLVGMTYIDRLSTLGNITEEASANSRLVMLEAAANMTKDYPLLGVGFGRYNQQSLVPQYVPSSGAAFGLKVIHNSYAQILTDSGVLALLLFVVIIVSAVILLQRSYGRVKLANPRLAPYPLALQVSIIVYAVGSMALSRESFDFYYMILICAAAWLELEPDLLQTNITNSPPAITQPQITPLAVQTPVSFRREPVPRGERKRLSPRLKKRPPVRDSV